MCTVQSLLKYRNGPTCTCTCVTIPCVLVPNEKLVRRNTNSRERADEYSWEISWGPRLYEKPYKLSLCRTSFSGGGGGVGGGGGDFREFLPQTFFVAPHHRLGQE